jgi:hypothetical protein
MAESIEKIKTVLREELKEIGKADESEVNQNLIEVLKPFLERMERIHEGLTSDWNSYNEEKSIKEIRKEVEKNWSYDFFRRAFIEFGYDIFTGSKARSFGNFLKNELNSNKEFPYSLPNDTDEIWHLRAYEKSLIQTKPNPFDSRNPFYKFSKISPQILDAFAIEDLNTIENFLDKCDYKWQHDKKGLRILFEIANSYGITTKELTEKGVKHYIKEFRKKGWIEDSYPYKVTLNGINELKGLFRTSKLYEECFNK